MTDHPHGGGDDDRARRPRQSPRTCGVAGLAHRVQQHGDRPQHEAHGEGGGLGPQPDVAQRAGGAPLDKLADHLKKMPKSLKPVQLTEVKQRLRALDAVRPKVPLPRGPMPSPKGLNRAMRGR